MATANVISSQFNTFNISNVAGDTVTTGKYFIRARNVSANIVSYSEKAAPVGVVTAGQQSSLQPASANKVDETILRPNTTYFFTAAAGASLVCFDELPSQPSY